MINTKFIKIFTLISLLAALITMTASLFEGFIMQGYESAWLSMFTAVLFFAFAYTFHSVKGKVTKINKEREAAAEKILNSQLMNEMLNEFKIAELSKEFLEIIDFNFSDKYEIRQVDLRRRNPMDVFTCFLLEHDPDFKLVCIRRIASDSKIYVFYKSEYDPAYLHPQTQPNFSSLLEIHHDLEIHYEDDMEKDEFAKKFPIPENHR